MREARITCQASPFIGSATPPARHPFEYEPIERETRGAGSLTAPNSSFANGLLNSAGVCGLAAGFTAAGVMFLGSSVGFSLGFVAGFNAAVLMRVMACDCLAPSFAGVMPTGFRRVLELTLFWEATTVGFDATELMTFLRAGTRWATTGCGARFITDVLVILLGDFTCSAATPPDASINVRHTITVRMLCRPKGCLCPPKNLAKAWA